MLLNKYLYIKNKLERSVSELKSSSGCYFHIEVLNPSASGAKARSMQIASANAGKSQQRHLQFMAKTLPP